MRVSLKALTRGIVLFALMATGTYAKAQSEGTQEEEDRVVCEVYDSIGHRWVYGFIDGKWTVIPEYPQDVVLPACSEAFQTEEGSVD